MSLIEHLLGAGWEPVLRRTFEVVLRVLGEDPFAQLATSGDDLRGSLRIGGVARLREALRRQLQDSRVDPGHQERVLEGLEMLIAEHHETLSRLVEQGIIPGAGLSAGSKGRCGAAGGVD